MVNSDKQTATMPLFEGSWEAMSALPRRVTSAKVHLPEVFAGEYDKAEYRLFRSPPAPRACSGRGACGEPVGCRGERHRRAACTRCPFDITAASAPTESIGVSR
jgi:hypothetical protein